VTQVKVCGLTRPEDVEMACALGAAYVGFNFSAVSLRRVSPERARDLSRATAPGVARVGVFVGESYGEIAQAVEEAALDLVQLHRPLAAEDLESVPRPLIAVAHAGREGEIPPEPLLERCAAILFDTAGSGVSGGGGVAFDWSLLDGRKWPAPLFVAGGLCPENVALLVRRVRPRAVDVASGVESAPGVKDPERMRRFFEAVRDADDRAR